MLGKLLTPSIFPLSNLFLSTTNWTTITHHPKDIIFTNIHQLSHLFPSKFLSGHLFRMSSFPNTVSEARRSGKAPEKSSFSQTCSLLSQFLKEKRASGDSALGMGGKMEPKGRIFVPQGISFCYCLGLWVFITWCVSHPIFRLCVTIDGLVWENI